MELAYLITKNHFNIEEVDFPRLRCITNNVIIEYNYPDNAYFRRSLFELSRLGFNIGVIVNDLNDTTKKDLIEKIKGFKINLGIWFDMKGIKDFNIIEDFSNKFDYNFIIGIKDDTKTLPYPIWGYRGNYDISEDDYVTFDFLREKVLMLRINTDYKKIYEENNFKPIPTNFIV